MKSSTIARRPGLPTETSPGARPAPPPGASEPRPLAEVLLAVLGYLASDSEDYVELVNEVKPKLEAMMRRWSPK